MTDFAILAPVPREHLDEACRISRDKGYVCFGSAKWERFTKVDELRAGAPVPVLIYPSHEELVAPTNFVIGWTGLYIGHVHTRSDKEADERGGHRPSSTEVYPQDNSGHWPLFWRVAELTELSPERQKPISSLASYGTGHWRANHPPRGPEIIARPEWI